MFFLNIVLFVITSVFCIDHMHKVKNSFLKYYIIKFQLNIVHSIYRLELHSFPCTHNYYRLILFTVSTCNKCRKESLDVTHKRHYT